ncbi:MAG: MoaD/ThiS family protein [Anaerolineaceae bacterium]
MSDHEIIILLYANLREKAGTNRLQMTIPDQATVADLKKMLKFEYPAMGPQLANVVVLVNKHHIFTDGDVIPANAEVTFLPPISGG